MPPPSRQEAREKKRKRRSSPSNNDRDEKENDDESEKESERRSSFLPSDVFVRNVLDVVGFVVVVVVDGALKVPQVVAVVTAMALPMKDIHFMPSPLPLRGGFIRRRPAEIIFADDDYSSFFFLCGLGVCFQFFFLLCGRAEGGGGTIRSEKSQKSSLSAFQKRADRQTKSFHDDHILYTRI